MLNVRAASPITAPLRQWLLSMPCCRISAALRKAAALACTARCHTAAHCAASAAAQCVTGNGGEIVEISIELVLWWRREIQPIVELKRRIRGC